MQKVLGGILIAALASFATAGGAQDLGGGTSIDVEPVTSTVFTRQGQEIRVYSAKLICGFSDRGPLAPGSYRTAINVHNPDPDNAVTFTKRVVEALPERAPEQGTVGTVSDPRVETLGANEAFEVDCEDALALLDGGLGGRQLRQFLKGFVVLETRGRSNQSPPLNVVGVYTVGGGGGREEQL